MEAHRGAVEVCLGALEAHTGALETHPRALESHSGTMEAGGWSRGGWRLEPCMLTLKRLHAQPGPGFMEA